MNNRITSATVYNCYTTWFSTKRFSRKQYKNDAKSLLRALEVRNSPLPLLTTARPNSRQLLIILQKSHANEIGKELDVPHNGPSGARALWISGEKARRYTNVFFFCRLCDNFFFSPLSELLFFLKIRSFFPFSSAPTKDFHCPNRGRRDIIHFKKKKLVRSRRTRGLYLYMPNKI